MSSKTSNKENFPSFPTIDFEASQWVLKQQLEDMSKSELIDKALYLNSEFSQTYYDFRELFHSLGFAVEICIQNDNEIRTRSINIRTTDDPIGKQAKFHISMMKLLSSKNE